MRWLYRILFWGFVSFSFAAICNDDFPVAIIASVILYYLNRITVREVLGRKKYFLYGFLFIVYWITLIIVVDYLIIEEAAETWKDCFFQVLKRVFISWFVLAVSSQATITKDWFEGFSIQDASRFKLKRLRYEKSKTELELLKTQLSPHFYKNLLTNIYDLVLNNNKSAPDAIVNLKELMEYMLYDTNGKEKTQLHKEVDFITKLLDIRKIGLSHPEQITLHINLPENIRNKEVMPFVLLPFIENLFTHCNFSSDKAFAKIELNYDHGGKLIYFVQNSYSESDKKSGKGGLGLPSLKLRLNKLYKNKYNLITEGKNGVFNAKLELKLSV